MGEVNPYKVSKAEELALMQVEDELIRLKKAPGYIYEFNDNMEKAAENGYAKAVKVYLDNGADINKIDFASFIYHASEPKHCEVVKVFIAAGVDMNVKADLGNTALVCASKNGHEEVVKILKEAGAKE